MEKGARTVKKGVPTVRKGGRIYVLVNKEDLLLSEKRTEELRRICSRPKSVDISTVAVTWM